MKKRGNENLLYLFLLFLLNVLSGCQRDCDSVKQAQRIPNEGWEHVSDDTSVTYQHNPPASGSHYEYWARYEVFEQVIAREIWLHNVEHGALVILYHPDLPDEDVEQLESIYYALPLDPTCGYRRALMTPDPYLDLRVAAVIADFVLEGDSLKEQEVLELFQSCRTTMPEDICQSGYYP